MINFKIKPFNKLSVSELYEILALRNEVFIVEQNCVYQDIDHKDTKAFHVIGFYQEKIVGYARVFGPGDYFENASIGRVIVHPGYRGKDFGHLLIQTSIEVIKSIFHADEITISAQLHLHKFYESHGFVKVGESYLEDDIPHIQMIKLRSL